MKVMDTSYSWSLPQRIRHHVMLNTFSLKNLGLLHGKMGISIAFYMLGKRESNKIYTDYAGDILDEIFSQVQNDIATDFDSGLAGIGWGVEYLIQHKLVAGDSLNICADIDQKIMQYDPRRIDDLSLEKGIYGLLHYVLIHIKGCELQQNTCPFDAVFLDDLYTKTKGLETNNRGLLFLRAMYLDYIENEIVPNYILDITALRKRMLNVQSEQLTTYPLGIQMGLTGTLLIENSK